MERENKMPKEILDLRLEEVPFVVFDTETSLMTYPGQTAFYDMVEIGCVAFNLEGKEIDSFHSLVKPYYPFNRASCKAMHITEAGLETAPTFPEIASFVTSLLANRVIVGQNTQFDIRTVKQAVDIYNNLGQIVPEICSQLIAALEMEYLDTKKIFSYLFPEKKQKSLDAIALILGINPERTKHSALEDARLTLKVFKKMVDLTKSKNVITLGHLFDFQEGKYGESKQISLF